MPPFERIRARVRELEPTIAKLRGLVFRQPVTVVLQTAPEALAHVRNEIEREFPRPADTSAALFHVGLVAAKVDIAEAQRALTTPAFAYYDDAQHRFTILQSPSAPVFADGLLVHELTHALQDQQFGLDRLLPASGLDADHVAARRFLEKGEATFMALWFELHTLNNGSRSDAVRAIRGQLDQLVRMSASDMIKQGLFGAAAHNEPTIDTAVHSLHEAPLTLMQPQIDAQFAGAQLVAAAFERGGWEAVNALYAHPPESTEQALHPETKLVSHRDPPVVLPIAAPADETVIDDRVFGELQWRVYFLLWAPNDNIVASRGWGGDHAVVTRLANGKLRARIATAWDSRSDADEFRRAYLASLVKRFPAGRGAADAPGGFDRGDGGGRITLVQDGVRVTINDGP